MEKQGATSDWVWEGVAGAAEALETGTTAAPCGPIDRVKRGGMVPEWVAEGADEPTEVLEMGTVEADRVVIETLAAAEL